MQIAINTLDKYIEIQIAGRVDATSTNELDTKLNECVQSATLPIIVNFKDVEYISSAGLRSILKLAKATQTKKLALRCCALQPAVFEVFKISGFSTILKIDNSLDDAIVAL